MQSKDVNTISQGPGKLFLQNSSLSVGANELAYYLSSHEILWGDTFQVGSLDPLSLPVNIVY